MTQQALSDANVEMTVSRPDMPNDYGIPDGDEGMLTWTQVSAWLEKAPVYWLATASLDGRPHATPIWGTWVDGAFYFDGSPDTRWARNLAVNPRIVVHIESGSSVVMLEGTVSTETPEAELFKRIADQSEAKYKYRPDSANGVYSVRPDKAFAWDNNDFAKTATRWRFGKR